ncbi:hypothetical protein [Natronobeatus ordinarius]|uniref:hypothetical protein n=1 Tax=Natronobeatus ordinarius TaxID=2963433 RepID=UPI0020CD8912|nr:hypothetical protein [Natronobeatus ordinarius]
MSNVDRRHFVLATAAAVTVGPVAGCLTGAEDQPVRQVEDRAVEEWELTADEGPFNTYADVRTTDDGSLLVGTARDDTGPAVATATKLTPGGDVVWERRYPSPDQLEALEDEVVGPIPEDGFAFSLPADDGFLLVGWTYYDGPAVYVSRLVRVDEHGEVRWERSFASLEDASAYSYLADGVVTDDGYLLCGIESPGIMLGGGGWLVSVAADGSLNWFERIPATERDLAETVRQDVFTGIVPVDDGYVLSGHYEPPEGGSRAWVVGIDERGSVRWEDDVALETAGPTRANDLAVSDEGVGYDLLVVGSAGAVFDARARSRAAITLEGDGFVAAYTADGDRRQFRELDGTPAFSVARSSRGLVAGGARAGRAWVGTPDRTDFEAADSSVVASLATAHEGELVAAGNRIDGDRVDAWARLIRSLAAEPDDRNDEEPKADPREWTFDFLDCETVRVTGDVADVLLNVIWWEEPDEDLVGTISEPVGGVEGERTIAVTEEFGEFPFGPVLTSVEAFAEGTPVVPGGGDVVVENPQGEECQAAILETFDGERHDTSMG